MTLYEETLECCHFFLEHSGIPAPTLFESAGYYYIEDFLDEDTFGNGHAGVDFALTDSAVDIIEKSECEPAGNRGDLMIWHEMWVSASRLGWSPTSKACISYARRVISLGVDFAPFLWPQPIDDWANGDFDEPPSRILAYQTWMLELCLGLGGDPNSVLGFFGDIVPLDYAIHLASVLLDLFERGLRDDDDVEIEEDSESQDDVDSMITEGYCCFECRIVEGLLTPLIKAGADIYHIRELGGSSLSLTDLAPLHHVEHLWRRALEMCGFEYDDVQKEDKRRMGAYMRDEPLRASGVDRTTFCPSEDGLRRRR
jgi:hypothetical protein